MTLNEYQEQAMTTCMESSNNFSYMFFNLVGEVGEFASKVAKGIRKGELYIGGNNELGTTIPNHIHYVFGDMNRFSEYNEALKKEAGDVLWQLAGLCKVMGWKLEDIAQMNLDKLAARKAANTIDGSGDGISGAERHA